MRTHHHRLIAGEKARQYDRRGGAVDVRALDAPPPLPARTAGPELRRRLERGEALIDQLHGEREAPLELGGEAPYGGSPPAPAPVGALGGSGDEQPQRQPP